MHTSDFEMTVENRFDYMCKLVMKNEKIDYGRYISNISKHEVSFSQIGESTVENFSSEDLHPSDFDYFLIEDILIGVEDYLLGIALEKLSDEERSILLLYYFLEKNDTDIQKIMNLKRSTVNWKRRNALADLRKIMEGER